MEGKQHFILNLNKLMSNSYVYLYFNMRNLFKAIIRRTFFEEYFVNIWIISYFFASVEKENKNKQFKIATKTV